MPKRSCPFPQNCNQMKMHIDMRHVGKEAYQQEVYGKFCYETGKQKKMDELVVNGTITGKAIVWPIFHSVEFTQWI